MHSSRMHCVFLLFPFLHSGVPSYADECKNEKYTYLFRPLFSVSGKSRHAERGSPKRSP